MERYSNGKEPHWKCGVPQGIVRSSRILSASTRITEVIRVFLLSVGLSNILNSELNRRKPVEGPHGQVVGTAVVKGKLL